MCLDWLVLYRCSYWAKNFSGSLCFVKQTLSISESQFLSYEVTLEARWSLRSYDFVLPDSLCSLNPVQHDFSTSKYPPLGPLLVFIASRTTKLLICFNCQAALCGVAFSSKWGELRCILFGELIALYFNHTLPSPLPFGLTLSVVSQSPCLNLITFRVSFTTNCHMSLVTEWRSHFILLFGLNSVKIYSGLTYFHY